MTFWFSVSTAAQWLFVGDVEEGPSPFVRAPSPPKALLSSFLRFVSDRRKQAEKEEELRRKETFKWVSGKTICLANLRPT